MIRVGGGLIFLGMARGARGGQSCVLIIYVTGGARRGGVFTGERELGLTVIKRCAQPVRCGMAQGTILREPGGDVVRRRGRPVLFCMAGETGSALR